MYTLINVFRIIAFLEGVSYLLLLGIAVPIKYGLNNPTYVKWLGMPHGLLFVAYIILTFIVSYKVQWSHKILGYVLLASVIPFATFLVDKKYLK